VSEVDRCKGKWRKSRVAVENGNIEKEKRFRRTGNGRQEIKQRGRKRSSKDREKKTIEIDKSENGQYRNGNNRV
jgi:hypothetical protein